MTNLASARAAIEAEIDHAKAGIAHFSARLTALETTLMQILSVDNGVLNTSRGGRRTGRIAHGASEKVGKALKAGNQLPFTGGDYWFNLVSKQPKSGADILHEALDGLGFAPTKQQVLKMTSRATFALNALVKTKKIQDSGEGRERRFFKV